MPKKDDLIAEAKRLGIELGGTETVAALEELIEAKVLEQGPEGPALEPGVYVLDDEGEMKPLPVGNFLVKQGLGAAEIARLEENVAEEQSAADGALTRRKVNRGSRRRIERTVAALNSQMDAAIKELDLQAFVADDDGNRVGEWPAVARLREAKAQINGDVNRLLAG